MKRNSYLFVLIGLLTFAGCGGVGSSTYLHPRFDFGFIETVGVIPFENLSDDQGAGARATRYFTGDLLATEAFAVVEPGEVARALAKQAIVRTAQLTEAQIKEVGRELGAQGLFLGSLSESTTMRRGTESITVVTVVLRLVETETGSTVWSTTVTEDSGGFWSSLFGTSQKSHSEVTRRCLERGLDSLMD